MRAQSHVEQLGSADDMPYTLFVALAGLFGFSLCCLLYSVLLVSLKVESDRQILGVIFGVPGLFSLGLLASAYSRRWLNHMLLRFGSCALALLSFKAWFIGSVFALIGASGGPNAGEFQPVQAVALVVFAAPFVCSLSAAILINQKASVDWLRARRDAV